MSKTSKFLSLILRHSPETINIQLDPNGWVNTDELITKMNEHGHSIDIHKLRIVVESNNKKRFTFNDDSTMIRANQGHSVEVNLELAPKTPPEFLYHGTATKNMEDILDHGIKSMNRNHVHLTTDFDTAVTVAKRHGSDITIIKVSALSMHTSGQSFYQSKNGVWLTEKVQPNFMDLYNEEGTKIRFAVRYNEVS